MTHQDQYASTVRQAQQAWVGAVESFTDNQQKAFGQSVSPLGLMDSSAAIDQVFDFWEKTLEVQRDVAKKLAVVTASVGESVREQALSAGEMVREQTESAKQTVRQQADSVRHAADEQSVKNYDQLTKVELQDELDRRDLPRTGNVDELRGRLIEDDHK